MNGRQRKGEGKYSVNDKENKRMQRKGGGERAKKKEEGRRERGGIIGKAGMDERITSLLENTVGIAINSDFKVRRIERSRMDEERKGNRSMEVNLNVQL